MEQYSPDRGHSALAISLIGIGAVAAFAALRRQPRAARARTADRRIHVHEAITINRPLPEVYRCWRDFERFPWHADVIGEREGDWIAWRSRDEADVQHSGSARFEHAPGARGTEVHVELQCQPRGGTLGHAVARLFGEDPQQQIREDLRRFKQLLEAGEISVSDGPSLSRPAQPPARREELHSDKGVMR